MPIFLYASSTDSVPQYPLPSAPHVPLHTLDVHSLATGHANFFSAFLFFRYGYFGMSPEEDKVGWTRCSICLGLFATLKLLYCHSGQEIGAFQTTYHALPASANPLAIQCLSVIPHSIVSSSPPSEG